MSRSLKPESDDMSEKSSLRFEDMRLIITSVFLLSLVASGAEAAKSLKHNYFDDLFY